MFVVRPFVAIAVKIASWNVNSVRSRVDRIVEYLQNAQPDVLCLQELKCTEETFPSAPIAAAGYHSLVFGQKTYNGVAILTREEPVEVLRGLQDGVEDPQSRMLAATVRGVRIFAAYAPNGQAVGSAAYAYKLEWFWRLRRFLEGQRPVSGLWAVCGDFNIAPEDRDVFDPLAWEGRTMASQPERDAFRGLLDMGLVDSFRLHVAEPNRFSWWDYRLLCFPKNMGLRIDHVLLSTVLASRCRAAGIDRDFRKGKRPSDHAPVWAIVDL